MKFINIYIFVLAGLLFWQCTPKVAEVIEVPVEQEAMAKKVEAWRSSAPEAGEARKIEMGEYNVFTMDNGMKVIVVENHKLPRVSYSVSLNSDPIVEGDKAGYISAAGDLMGRGTKSRTKAEIDKSIDQIGASLSTFSTGMFGSSLTKHQHTMLEIYADVLLNPSFPKEEFDKIKTQTLSGLQSSKDDPNTIASNVAGIVNYGVGHPYAEVVTEETVNNIDLASCKKYYSDHFRPNNAYLTIVGDITLAEAKANANKYFGAWKKGKVPTASYDLPARPKKTSVAFAHKEGAVQSVINVTYPVYIAPGSDDELRSSLMNAILGGGVFLGRLMQNLREDKAYTYGARSSISSDKLVGRFNASASVRNEVTDSSIVEFIYEMDRMVNEPVSKEDLQLAKNSMAGSFARSLESPQSLARYARNIVRYNLPEDHYTTYLERLDAITVGQVQETARKYVTADNANIVVVGNQDEIADKLVRFDGDGVIDFYDAFGNKIEVDNSVIPDGITAESIISKFIERSGGKKKLEGLKSLETHYTMNAMGMNLNVDTYKMAPNKVQMKITTGGQVFQEQTFDGVKGYRGGMGSGGVITEGAGFDELKKMAIMFEHLNYLKGDYKLELKGLDKVNGESCYKIAITDPSGQKSTEYYGAQSGYLLRTLAVNAVEGSNPVTMVTDFSDYQQVGGISQPGTVSVSGVGPAPMKMVLKEFKVNEAIDASIFEIKE
jgi:predicted Zn-dependent peptidase